ncbi:MAG: di-heme-cytochrome C peroxidase, partial [Chromatiales bacterium]|nr:di-heme-cytochrome C peroxidase [Chromatiales bacterium]
MIPVDWFLALVDVDGESFATPEKLAKYGFIPAEKRHDLNPYDLPIGFAIEETETKGVQLGLTCAACHTANISVQGRNIRIDGGQAALDLDSFYQSLARAVSHTLINPQAFSSFSAKVLTDGGNDASRAALRKEFTEFEVRIRGDAEIRRPEVESGFGRVDALTQIVNALAVNNQSIPLNLRPVESPTSYP